MNLVIITLYGRDAVNGFNEAVKLEGQLVARMPGGKSRPAYRGHFLCIAESVTLILWAKYSSVNVFDVFHVFPTVF